MDELRAGLRPFYFIFFKASAGTSAENLSSVLKAASESTTAPGSFQVTFAFDSHSGGWEREEGGAVDRGKKLLIIHQKKIHFVPIKFHVELKQKNSSRKLGDRDFRKGTNKCSTPSYQDMSLRPSPSSIFFCEGSEVYSSHRGAQARGSHQNCF